VGHCRWLGESEKFAQPLAAPTSLLLHNENIPWPPGRVFDALGHGIFSLTVSLRTVSVPAPSDSEPEEPAGCGICPHRLVN
jgi:hypothetical protein